ncbi:MAG: hypothetical protein R2941_15030 [Desulfobacterales bacterium]
MGENAHLTCNRLIAVRSFRENFRNKCRECPNSPQVYSIPGYEDECY